MSVFFPVGESHNIRHAGLKMEGPMHAHEDKKQMHNFLCLRGSSGLEPYLGHTFLP